MRLLAEQYISQVNRWPKTGRHILAHFNDRTVVVYQSCSPAIARLAVARGHFGSIFNLNQVSWIQTHFLWLMHGSEWGKKPGQEAILAVEIRRSAFNQMLKAAVSSRFVPEIYASEVLWKQALQQSSVWSQWETTYYPSGKRIQRQAIQLGLRKRTLLEYAIDAIVSIEDITEFVRQQYEFVRVGNWIELLIPSETIYPIANTNLAKKLQLSVPY